MKRILYVLAVMGLTASQVIGADIENKKPSDAPPGSSASTSEIEQLRRMLAEQQKQINELRQQLAVQQSVGAGNLITSPLTSTKPVPGSEVASLVPVIAGAAPATQVATTPAVPASASQAPQRETPSPLQFKIGEATITPIGFMDITNTYRSTNAGTSLQTNFGSFPYNNTLQGRLSEDKWSAENSRLGLRVDAKVSGANILGYFEGDFVGGVTGNNTQVSSNSMLFRIRQYYVDVRRGFWEVLAGQAWSMITPNRRGLSPLPADLFYGQVVDVNYINGLYWGRIPGFRFIGHPSRKVAFGLALENSTQYFGGSGGGGVPTLPSALAASYPSQLDNGANNDRTLPNVHPDVLAKLAFDLSTRLHLEFGGVESTVKVLGPAPGTSALSPTTGQYLTKAGGAGTLGINVGLAKNLRVMTYNFYGDGAGRYLFGVAPNFIVRADGSPSPVHAASTVSGFEATIKNFAPYIYYGGIYIGRDSALDFNGTTRIGYGYPGSPNSQNRSVQEITTGWTHTIWRDGKYGALQWMAEYAYFFRNPWSVAPGAAKNAHETAVWFNLRYVLPGTAPTVEY